MKVEITKSINLENYEKITNLKIKEKIHNGFIVIRKDKYDILSDDGKVYEYFFSKYQHDYNRTLIQIDRYYYILLDDSFNVITSFTANYAVIIDDNLIVITNTNGNYYLMDLNGCVLCNSYSYLNVIDNSKKFIAKNEKYGVLDLAGNTIIPFDYDDITYSLNYPNYLVGRKKGHNIIFDTSGTELTDIKSNNLEAIGKDLFLERYSDYNKIKILDINKNVLFKSNLKKLKINYIAYSIYAGFYSNKKLILWVDDIATEKYIICADKIKTFAILQSKKIDNKYYFKLLDKNSGNNIVYDNTGTNITDSNYSVARLTDFDNIFYVEKNNKFGVIKDNKLLIDYKYDSYFDLPSLIGLEKEKIIYIYDKNLNEVVKFSANEFKGIDKINNFYLVRNDEKQALYTLDWHNIVPFTDSNIIVVDNNKILIDNYLVNLDSEYANMKFANKVKISIFDNTIERFFETDSAVKEFINYASDIEKEYSEYIESAKTKLIKYKK